MEVCQLSRLAMASVKCLFGTCFYVKREVGAALATHETAANVNWYSLAMDVFTIYFVEKSTVRKIGDLS